MLIAHGILCLEMPASGALSSFASGRIGPLPPARTHQTPSSKVTLFQCAASIIKAVIVIHTCDGSEDTVLQPNSIPGRSPECKNGKSKVIYKNQETVSQCLPILFRNCSGFMTTWLSMASLTSLSGASGPLNPIGAFKHHPLLALL